MDPISIIEAVSLGLIVNAIIWLVSTLIRTLVAHLGSRLDRVDQDGI